MSYTLNLDIPGLPETTNQILSMRLKMRFKRKSFWKQQVFALSHGKRPVKPIKRGILTLTRCSSARCDYDGLVSSFKVLIDALVICKVLENDKYENIGNPTYKWEPAKRGEGFCRITLEETP